MRARTAALAIITVIICALFFSASGVSRISALSRSSAARIMNLTCETSTTALNEQLMQIEHSLSVISAYIREHMPQPEEVAEDYSLFEEHLEQVAPYFASIVSTNPGIYAYYYRYQPEVYADRGGFFMISEQKDGVFESAALTDATQYDPDDVEHVGWYYIPKETGEPMWMDPYWNANDGTYTLSYVVPLKAEDGEVVGVVGIDLDFEAIIADVQEVTAYESGYAYLLQEDGVVIWHPQLEAGTDIRTISPDLSEFADLLTEESSGSEIYDYTYEGRTMETAFCSLRNGMRFALSAPLTEIDAARDQTVRQFLLISLLAVAVCAVITFIISGRMTRPLTHLTNTAREISKGKLDAEFPKKSPGEIGILSDTMQKMVKSLKRQIAGLSDKAYRDALTGVRNKGAFEEEMEKYRDGTKPFALVMFDVNYLKKINDTYGHEKGDLYLKNACSLICHVFAHCPVFRMGGDEFVAVLAGEHTHQADELIDEMERKTVECNAAAANPWDKISCAKGAAAYDPDADGSAAVTDGTIVETTLKRADEAMYKDKEGKRRE